MKIEALFLLLLKFVGFWKEEYVFLCFSSHFCEYFKSYLRTDQIIMCFFLVAVFVFVVAFVCCW